MLTTAGAPLLMLPGTLCDERVFAAATSTLRRQRYTVEMAGELSAPQMARRVLELAPRRFALLGFSLGAIVGLEVVAQAPERVERIALLGCNARAMPDERAAGRRAAVTDAAQRGTASYIAEVWDASVPAWRRDDAGLRAELEAMAASTLLASFEEQVEISINRVDHRPGLAAITVPALVACGAEDRVCPPELSREIANGIAGSRLAIVERAGHYLTLDQPEITAQLLAEWLAAPAQPNSIASKEFS
ncbi:MAG: alpha/beta fold hydrolase [Hyphomicrobiales bacterium]|jgi:pimeloyl-ACP methyl ester carboxylesterase|nr:MAG: alpha/beta fold hydrolase [Hyphomicrobiales bacterium]